MRKISRHIEISFDPVSDFLREEKTLYDSMSPNVYNTWRDWLREARSDDRGYSFLCEPYSGALATINGWYEEVKKKTLSSAKLIPSTKPEVGIIDDIDNKVIKELGKNIKQLDKPILKPADWANATNLIGNVVMYLFYRAGANAYRFDLVVERKQLRNVVTKDLVSHLDIFVRTWEDSFPKANLVYRMAYVCADAYQPPEQQIFPNIKPSADMRKFFGPKKVRNMILTTPEIGVRNLILGRDSYNQIRSAQDLMGERRLCPAALLKTRVPKEKVEDYLERMRNSYPELYGTQLFRTSIV